MSNNTIPFHQIDQLLLPVIGLDDKKLKEKLGTLGSLARHEWIRLAQQNCRSSRKDYVAGIQPVEINGTTALIVLVGSFPNMVEHGASAFDMRETLLPSAKAKTSEKGYRYLAVPFRHKAASLSTGGMAAVMNGKQMADIAIRDMAKDVRTSAQKLTATRSAAEFFEPSGQGKLFPGKRTEWGGRLNTSEMSVPLLRERHAGNIYEGMVRLEKTYKSATQSQYMTWRMISDNPATTRSDEGGGNWMHPGISARNIAPMVSNYIQQVAPGILGAGA